jgi:hypothetical protein
MRTRHDHPAQDLAVLTHLLQDLAEDLPPARAQRLKVRLITEIRAEPSRPPASGRLSVASPRGRRRPSRLALGASAAIAGLATVMTVVTITAQQGTAYPPASPAAIRLLAKIASAAARQPAPHVRDSQYMYVETKTAGLSPFHLRMQATARPLTRASFPHSRRFLRPVTSQTWIPVADVCRTGLARTTLPQGAVFNSRFSAQGPYSKCPSTGSLNDASYRLLQTLPADPRSLLALIYRAERGHGPSPDQEAFVTIGDLLRDTIPPPDVAAALYRAAALIPGVTLVAHATDAIGRNGVAVAQTAGGFRSELIFSPKTLQLIGERTGRTGKSAAAVTTAIISQGFVDYIGQLPPGTQSPIS